MEQYIGLDIHRKFIRACVMDQAGTVADQLRLELDDPDRLVEFFNGFHPESTEVVMEATVGWMWLADVLEGMGLNVHLAHMRGVRVIAESRCKSPTRHSRYGDGATDKIDARTLAHLLRTNYLPEAYLAPAPVRDERMVLRHRQGLISWRVSAKNKVHAILMRYNIHLPGSDIFGLKGLRAP